MAPEPVETGAHGRAAAILDGNTLTVVGGFAGLSSALRDIEDTPEDPGIHIHPGAEGETSSYIYGLAAELGADERSGIFFGTFELSDNEVAMLMEERLYFDIHTEDHDGGEVRDQLRPDAAPAGVAREGEAEGHVH